MGKYYCSITYCHNFSGRIGKFGKSVTLHKLPKHSSTRQAWIRAISRKNWKPTSYTRVCSDHFKDGVGPNSVDRNKIPCENLPQKKPCERTERKAPCLRQSTVPVETVQSDIADHHTYAKKQTTGKGTDQSTRTSMDYISTYSQSSPAKENSSNISTQVSMPEIVVENIQDSNDMVMFYTGLPNFHTFQALFDSLMEHGADKLCTESVGEMNYTSLGRKRKLRQIDEFLLVMMRLRLGLLLKDLEFRFKISANAVSKIFNAWILFMCECLRSLVFLPKLEVLKGRVPKCFEKFSDTRIILDCTEVFIQSPSSLENKSLTYSSYKSHDTFKSLVGVSMTGAVVLVSKLWPGSTSDVEITRNSGLFEQLDKGDAVMVDKGFIHIQSDLKPLGVKLYCP